MWRGLKQALARRIYEAIKRVETDEIQATNERLKKKMKSCGKGVGLRGPIHITGVERVELGDNVHIGANAYIRAEGGLAIGENTHISRHLLLYTINHRVDGDRLPF